jgi:transcriptional regulator with XRE-family HTH domain
MRRLKATADAVDGSRESQAIAANLGRDLRETRRRQRLPQREVARRAGISRPRLAELERGEGASAPMELWARVAMAIRRPLAVSFSRDVAADGAPRDAGHLAAQELILRLARAHCRRANVELATRPADPSAWADLVLSDDRSRTIILVEIVNRASDLGATARTTDRKAAELEAFAVAVGGAGRPYRVARGWLLVDTTANRRLVATYPEFLRARFPGSSRDWARSVGEGADPPHRPAIAWVDPRHGTIRALRLRG